ncbi:hypothetical protein ACP275_08G229300 [Erythranthe tilingii]
MFEINILLSYVLELVDAESWFRSDRCCIEPSNLNSNKIYTRPCEQRNLFNNQ